MKPPKLNSDPDFSVHNWGTEHLNGLNTSMQLKVTECHIKMDGTFKDKPVLYFVCGDGKYIRILAGISLRMFMPVLEELHKKGKLPSLDTGSET